MKIIVGADIVSTASNENAFVTENMERVIGNKLYERLKNNKHNIFNLEAPLYNGENRSTKCGVCMKMPVEVKKGIKDLNISLLTLANNHIMDYGEEGLKSTINALKSISINYTGIGNDVVSAKQPYIIEESDVKVAVLSVCEHEFSYATFDKMGANPFDPLDTLDEIMEIKKNVDFLIVLYHGGKEFYRYPSPYLQRLFRRMANKGANFVVAQHTHCIGCFEEYDNSLLLYGQGNFIFDRIYDEYWNSGVLVELNITKDNFSYDFIPFEKNINGIIKEIEEDSKKIFLDTFYNRSKKIKDPRYVEMQYDKLCDAKFEDYLRVIHGNNKLWFRVLNKLRRGGLVFKKYDLKSELGVLNYIECEAHRELLINALRKRNLK